MKLSTNLSILNKERNDKWSYHIEEFSNVDLDFYNKLLMVRLYGILNPQI